MLLPRPRSRPNERRKLTLNLDEKPGDPQCLQNDNYRIDLYEPQGFISIVLHHIWDIEQSQKYRCDLRAVTGRMIRSGGYKGAVLDASRYPVQRTEVMQQHSNAMRTARFIFNVKASVFSPHPIVGRQIVAATTEGYQRAFSNAADAMDWLLT